jgi:hypothetical protein
MRRPSTFSQRCRAAYEHRVARHLTIGSLCSLYVPQNLAELTQMKGIDWTRLTAEDLVEMPILAELKRMTTSNA